VGNDQFYSNGIMIRWTSPEFGSDTGVSGGRRGLRDLICSLAPLRGGEYRHTMSVSLLQKMFTSRDITIEDPAPGSWPYSGMAALEIGFQSRRPGRMDSFALSLGLLGEHSYAGRLQVFLHKLFDFKTPAGWHHQLGDRVLLNMFYETIALNGRWGGTEGFAVDLFSQGGCGVGNAYIGAGGGLLVRAGWNMPRDFGPSRIGRGSQVFHHGKSVGIGFHAGFDLRLVLHDITLDASAETAGPGPGRTPVYGEVLFGIEIYRDRLKISFSGVLWTKRIPSQPGPHVFGSLNLSHRF
jgi:lipid A 3-O-deacylase